MGNCDYCGENVELPYRCSYCRGTFCSEHRLPENHNCTELKAAVPPPKSYIRDERKVSEGYSEPKTETTTQSKAPILVIFLIISLGVNIVFWSRYDQSIKLNESLNERLLLSKNSLAQKEEDNLALKSMLEERTDKLDETVNSLMLKNREFDEFRYESEVAIRESYDEGFDSGYSEGYETGNKVGFSEGNETGYFSGYDLGFAKYFETTGFDVRDPTYKEMKQFLRDDTTDEEEYVDWEESEEGYFMCGDYSIMLKINAFKAGYRCFYVSIDFPEGIGYGHALNAFNTTDRGIVFIDPQGDWVVDLKVGDQYWRSIQLARGWKMERPDYDDTVIRIDLVP
jgi:hypothetical protein